MSASIRLPDDELAEALRDLGRHLDLGPGDTPEGREELVTAVLAEINRPVVHPRPWLRGAAAAAAVLIAALLVATPSRDAIAGWLGIGGVRITLSEVPLPSPEKPEGQGTPVDLEEASGMLSFPIRLPDPSVAGEPLDAVVDPAAPVDLVEIRYPDFTLVELASLPGAAPTTDKWVGPDTTVTAVDIGARPGLWIAGEPHQISYLRPDGTPDLDTVRRAGDVLVWEDAGVTYRIEGLPSLDEALAVAESLG